MNTVTASFTTTVKQMTEMSEQKMTEEKKPGSCVHMCS